MAHPKTTVRGRAPLARDSQQCSGTNNWAAPLHAAMCDWIRDRLDGKPLRHPGQGPALLAST